MWSGDWYYFTPAVSVYLIISGLPVFILVHSTNHFPAHHSSRGAQVFQKSRSHFKILGAKWVTSDTLQLMTHKYEAP